MTIKLDMEHFDTSKGRPIPAFSWDCPFCKRAVSAQVIEHAQSSTSHKGRKVRLRIRFMECPHPICKQIAIRADLEFGSALEIPDIFDPEMQPNELPMDQWLWPIRSDIKEFPDYIPRAIRQDYEEACVVRTLSPKASATLSRRCLQGMIRDFHGIVGKSNLKQEIDAIKDRVNPEVWEAIDGLRTIGNIGAHMEQDVNLLLDVDEEEAQLLIELNEQLFREWYINRENRRLLSATIKDRAAAKKKTPRQVK